MDNRPYEKFPTGGRLALDIETISPDVPYDEYPDFDDPTDFELLATALVYEPPGGGLDDLIQVLLWRDGVDADSEALHAHEVAQAIISAEPQQIITYNGDRFDRKLLLARAKRAGQTIGDSTAFATMGEALDRDHLDLKPAAWEQYGEYTTLEQVAEKQGLEVRETKINHYNHGHDLGYRSSTDPPYLQSGDIPELGEALLRTQAGLEETVNLKPLRDMLRDYALGDIEHLLALADRHPF